MSRLGAAALIGLFCLTLGPAALAAEDAALEAQVQEVEDELEIRRLLSRYGYYLDDRDFDSYAALFAEDGEWIGGFGQAKTPAGIRKMLEDADMGPNSSGPDGHASVHLMTNAIIEVEGDTATALSKYTVLEQGEDGAPRIRRAGHYRDRLVREDGVWKFLQRRTFSDIPAAE